jgi:L-arabinokinase
VPSIKPALHRPNPQRPVIVLYTSSHGFGHAVRCAALCRALLTAAPGVRIVVRTAAPAWIFPDGVEIERCIIDAGVVQPNSLDIDPQATLERYAALLTDEEARVQTEASRVRELGAQVIVADVPAAAFEIAARAGIPGLALANFSWDWIYEPFVEGRPAYAPLLDHLRAQYGRCSRLLRLPFSDGLTAFPVTEDVPLIARRSGADRVETRRSLGLPLEAPLVLFSFGGHASQEPDADRLATLGEYAFVTTTSAVDSTEAEARAIRRGRSLYLLPQLTDGYVDLLAACDAAVIKPGYGIVSDLIANRVPSLYVSRDGFREEPLLVRALETEARAVAIDRAALDQLDLRRPLDRLLALDRPWTERQLDGAEVIARRILELAG